MENLNGQNLMTFGIVALAILAIWNTVWASYKNYREAKKPRDDEKARLAEVEEHLDNDNKRLNDLEQSTRLMLRGMVQLLDHEIDGNHTELLAAVRDDIETFLINR